jgi:predicted unusual protein kinase regulating ubiquinone biosynthesis (AarF/ABC1/UbiB family)
MKEKLITFTNSVPYSHKLDIDYDTIRKLQLNTSICIYDVCPIQSGMVSLVFEASDVITNEKKVVKLLRVGIREKLESAIGQINMMAGIFSSFDWFDKYKIDRIIQDNVDTILSQIDFLKEVQNITRMRENCKNLDYVVIPEPLPEITKNNPTAIVMQFIEGDTITNIQNTMYKKQFAKQVVKFGTVTSLLHGYVHGDLHSGNILFIHSPENNPEFKIGILDFGIMHDINCQENNKTPFRENMMAVFSNIFTNTAKCSAVAILESGVLEPVDAFKSMDKNKYDQIATMLSLIIQETLQPDTSDNGYRKLYEFIRRFYSFLSSPELKNLGVSPSNNLIKGQSSLVMSQGVTIDLCGDDYLELSNEVIRELFHLDYIK